MDILSFMLGKQSGGSSTTVEELSVTENGTYTADTGKAYSPVTVEVTGVDPEADVRFFDPYDGSVVASYSAADFANLTELPANPTHEGLTSQGWNWTLADAKEQVAWSGYLDIGQHYVTNDGATRVYVHMNSLFPVRVRVGVNGTVSVDWGDGTTPDTMTGSNYGTMVEEHTYTAIGDYVVKISATTGDYKIVGSSSGGSSIFTRDTSSFNGPAQCAVQRIEVGNNVAEITGYAFYALRNCKVITVPISMSISGDYVFSYTSLKTFSIPNGTTSLGQGAFCISFVEIVSLPKNLTTIGNRFLGANHFLHRVAIPKDASSLGYIYQQAYAIKKLSFPQNITTIPDTYAASSSIKSVVIPSNITSIGASAFHTCDYLGDVTFPSGLTTIGNSAFLYCYALTEVVFPATLTSIGSSAFGSCSALTSIKFLGSTPPTVGSGAFSSLPTQCTIYVPSGSLSAYTGTSNMPSSSTYTYEEY